MSQNNVCKSYDKIYLWFDKNRNKNLIEIEYLKIIIHNTQKGSNVLDLGCGTGEPLAKFFIENNYNLTGVDGSLKMVELCKKRFPDQRFIFCDMKELNLNQKFEVIIAWDSFFHLNKDNQRYMFKVFSSHTKLNGFLLFTSGPEESEVWSDNNGENLYHASLSEKEYRKLLKKYGFEVLKYKSCDPLCQEHTVWLARKIL